MGSQTRYEFVGYFQPVLTWDDGLPFPWLDDVNLTRAASSVTQGPQLKLGVTRRVLAIMAAGSILA